MPWAIRSMVRKAWCRNRTATSSSLHFPTTRYTPSSLPRRTASTATTFSTKRLPATLSTSNRARNSGNSSGWNTKKLLPTSRALPNNGISSQRPSKRPSPAIWHFTSTAPTRSLLHPNRARPTARTTPRISPPTAAVTRFSSPKAALSIPPKRRWHPRVGATCSTPWQSRSRRDKPSL